LRSEDKEGEREEEGEGDEDEDCRLGFGRGGLPDLSPVVSVVSAVGDVFWARNLQWQESGEEGTRDGEKARRGRKRRNSPRREISEVSLAFRHSIGDVSREEMV
jgi:hypothetical protein